MLSRVSRKCIFVQILNLRHQFICSCNMRTSCDNLVIYHFVDLKRVETHYFLMSQSTNHKHNNTRVRVNILKS